MGDERELDGAEAEAEEFAEPGERIDGLAEAEIGAVAKEPDGEGSEVCEEEESGAASPGWCVPACPEEIGACEAEPCEWGTDIPLEVFVAEDWLILFEARVFEEELEADVEEIE